MKKLSKLIISLFLALSISFSIPANTYALSTAKYDSQANQNVTKIAKEAAKYDSDYDRVRYVVSWLIANNNYNEELYEKYEQGYDDDDLAHYGVSALVPGLSPVCDGYSHAFKQICELLKFFFLDQLIFRYINADLGHVHIIRPALCKLLFR